MECDEIPTHFLRTNRRDLLKPLCKLCAKSFPNFEISEDLMNEYLVQEVMES